MDELGRDGAGNGDAHGGEAVGDEARIRFVAVVMAGDPDFVGTDVGNDDVVFAHDAAAVDEGFLRLDREGHIVGVAFVFVDHLLADIQELFRFSQAGGFGHDAFQRVGDVADDFDFGLIVLVDIGRHGVDVDDVGIGQMPFGRGVFDDVIADGDDQAGLFQHFRLVVVHRDADGPHGIFVVKGNGTFGHHRVDDRELQFFRKGRELFGRFAADDAAAGQDDRVLGIGNHGSRCFDLRFQGCFRQDALMLQRFFIVGDGHLADVDRQVDEGSARFFPFGIFEGQAGDFSHRVRTDDGVGPAGDRFEHGPQVEVLMGRDVHFIGADLAGNGDQRGPVAVGIGDAGDQVGSPRAESGHADTGFAGQTAIDIGHEGCALFMADCNEFNL